MLQTENKMKISLKRALKLRKELEAMLSKIELPTSVSVSLLIQQNVDEPAAMVIGPGVRALTQRIDEYMALSLVLANLRQAIAKANVEQGVEAALAQAAHHNRVMAILKKLASAGVTPAEEQLKAELAYSLSAMQSPERGYGANRAVNVSVVLPELRDKAAAGYIEAKRSLEAIEDNRAGLNAAVHLELAEGDANLVRQTGLI
ncbi:hypothetical protein [Bradyrhizobium sp. SZCCHNPS1003]|uniref:hypothetical protein n=1 Tax=Bradyrhizobium sp. SZCCHNPS1003 TaxID=3057330 RepID=UPI0028E4AD8B|nr:hypothetical protein [Bradyrhizobium sp. SZCCHNPS1003]